MAIKSKIITMVLLAAVSVASYHYGTINPNKKLLQKIHNDSVAKVQKEWEGYGYHEPEMIYSDNDSFIVAVDKCVSFVNLSTPPLLRVDRKIIIAMAIVESGYGTSRFALQGNNLFGIRTWDSAQAQMKPKENPNAEWGVKTFITKCQSVTEAIRILNTLEVYSDFRKERETQLDEGFIDLDRQAQYLAPWSTNPLYIKLIQNKIKNISKLLDK